MDHDSADHESASHAVPLDSMLVQAATGPLRRFLPDSSTARWAGALARQPRTLPRRLGSFAVEAGRIAAGVSHYEPQRRDRRFADDAWKENPFLRRVVQLYLSGSDTVQHLVADADLEPRDEKRVQFFVDNVVEALSPSNLLLLNPTSAKAVIDTGGLSLLRGGSQFVKDMAVAPRIPEMVDASSFELGRNIAATPGEVVFRNDVFELIQYTPQTDEVWEVPLLLVPPTINKFYAIDLAPDRSLVEHSVKQGRQVFVMSWRNPDVRHAKWNLDTYVTAILDSLSAVERISGSEQTLLGGICSGGIMASITAAYMAATDQLHRVKALLLAVTVIDNQHPGTVEALESPALIAAAKLMSQRQGYLDGRALAEVFAWLRPGDLVWNYWVNNYLCGKRPPAFDILFWNSDTTRMTAGLHADFLDLSLNSPLRTPGELKILDVPVDLAEVDLDAYIVGGIADHITPWANCYHTTQMLGGESRFVLSTSGHIAALVNPPGNPKASFRTNKTNPADPQQWLDQAETHEGSWWVDASSWLADRSGARVPAPTHLGEAGQKLLGPAPGTYVFDK